MPIKRIILFGFLLFSHAYTMPAHETKAPCLTYDEKIQVYKLTDAYFLLKEQYPNIKISSDLGAYSCSSPEGDEKVARLVESIKAFVNSDPDRRLIRIERLKYNNVIYSLI